MTAVRPKVKCFICARDSEELPPASYRLAEASFRVVKCRACGTYAFNDLVQSSLTDLHSRDAPKVSAFARERDLRGRLAVFVPESETSCDGEQDWVAIQQACSAFPQSLQQRLDRGLVNLSLMAETPAKRLGITNDDYALLYAEDLENLVYMIGELEQRAYVRVSSRSNWVTLLQVTSVGWEKIEALRKDPKRLS